MKNRTKVSYATRTMTTDQFFNAYAHLAKDEKEYILLESGRDGKYSIAGIAPLAKIQLYEGKSLEVVWRDGKRESFDGDPLEDLMQFAAAFQVETNAELPPFQGGLMGFISYDYARYMEELPDLTKEVVTTPALFFYVFDQWAVIDLLEEKAYFATIQEKEGVAEEIASQWTEASRLHTPTFTSTPTTYTRSEEEREVSVSQETFEEMVGAVQSYIEQGDVTQVNLSVRQARKSQVSPLQLYEVLRQVNPSPYMASIGAKEFAVASSSPELLLKKRGNLIETRPIGGTRRRGQTPEEDKANELDLLQDEKERAEHVILVDLEKEDFTKVCQEGSVETNEFMVIEKYSHVMHLVSNVRGKVEEEVSNADIVKAVFPGGTITGAPKLRTMEIIEELEPEKRGLYTGSIGWFGFNGDFELNVVIRTAMIQNDQIHIQAGAGLVKESIPAAEYVESLAKGEALWKAVDLAEEIARGKGE